MKTSDRAFYVWLAILLIAQAPLLSQSTLKDKFPWFHKPKHVPVFPDLAISPDQLSEALEYDKIIPVDLRSAEAFQAGHIPGAIHLDLSGAYDLATTRSTLESKGLCGTRTIVLYGDSSDLSLAGSAFLYFEAAGYTTAKILLGGYSAWVASGGEAVQAQPPSYPPCTFDAQTESEIIIDRKWVADHFGQRGTEILDLRGPGGWESGGYHAPLLFSQGHIPHSLPLDISALFDDEGGWPAPTTSRALLGRLGPRLETYVDLDATFVLYGTGPDDPRPGLAYLLLRAMDIKVKVFTGGYQSWVADKSSPIVRIASTAELKRILGTDQLKEGAVVFDLREEWDFRDGHLPGAESLPSHEFATQLEQRIGNMRQPIGSETPLILYCYGKDCIRSRECATIAARRGFLNLLWYREGIDGWRHEGGIIESVGERSRATTKIYDALEGFRKPAKPL